MRTSKEELIQRGILLPGDPGLNSGLSQDSRAASPRLNLPQLVLVNKSGEKSTSSDLFLSAVWSDIYIAVANNKPLRLLSAFPPVRL